MSRYIKLDDATNHCKTWRGLAKEVNDRNGWWMAGNLLELMQDTPSIDIVRCKECKWAEPNREGDYDCKCHIPTFRIKANDFCSYGERREP